MKRIETKDVFYEIDDGILFCSYKENIMLDINVAKRIVSDRLAFSKGTDYLILIDFNNLKSADKDAREYMNSPNGGLKGLIGGAFVSDKIVASVFINLYLKINKPKIPTKFFTQRIDALNWLKSIDKL